ncbi:MAG: S8 family serine peptidase [Bacteroidales bacterium]|nr:S8 family serine peptidase [Bacteroidales bacterium]
MKTNTVRFTISFVFLLNFLFTLTAQITSGGYDLLLKFGNVNVQENLDKYIENFDQLNQKSFNQYYYNIVQFYQIPTPDEKLKMENIGMVFLDYIPDKAYTVAFPVGFNIQFLRNYKIRSILEILPEYKQALSILDKDYPEWSLHGNDEIAVIVSYYSNINMASAKNSISPFILSITQTDDFAKSQIIQAKISNLEQIINQPFVSFVEPLYPDPQPENYTGKTLHNSNVLDSDYDAGRHYDGTGINIMLQDDGIIGPHIDYEGRIGNQYITSNYGDHGDHCAGIIFGAGNLDPTTTGMAPGAELYTYGAAPTYPGFELIPNHYSNPGIRISSTSYSNGCNAGYTTLARTMDLHIRNYESLMHVFSAGNSGTENCGYGAGAGWGNVTGGHKIGKNVIATANLDYKDALSNSSSRGPAHDGRIKPDISAKGSTVYSTVDPNTYANKSGTSMACPGIAGSLAQLYQAYKELNGGQEPQGGLMKGLILNTAEDLGNPGPDFKYGWGRINNLRAVKTLEENRYFVDEISQGETNTHAINIPSGTKQMRVMVYWTDKEASVGTSKALVNDLDITLSDPSNNDYYPWLLSHYPNPDSLNKPAGKGIDRLNNMEQVEIDDPQSGNYTLTIDGYEIPFGPQGYYVLYDFVSEEVTLTYPQGGEVFAPGESIVIRWDAQGTADNFILEYSDDSGQNWTVINDNIAGNLRYYNWSLPSNITGEGLVKVSRNGYNHESEETFSIMQIIQDIEFIRSCPNSVTIGWDPIASAEYYNVYQLGEKYMEMVGTTTADTIEIDGVNFEDEHWFSVQAVGANDIKGRRSIAEKKSTGVWNCIFNKDIAVMDIISPPIGVLFSCQDFSDLNVKMEIKNSGMEAITNIPVYYQFENGTVESETYNGTLQPGETIIYEFSSSVSLPSNGIYEISAWIEVPEDENAYNDIVEGVCKLKSEQTMPVFTNIDFDEFNPCSYEPECEDIACYIDNKWYNLQNNLNDQIDWRLLNGITPTANTGPVGDHTTGTIEGNFLYLEPSGECYNKKAILMSPCIDLGNLSNPGMSFWFNMYGADMGSLHIDVISNGELIKDVILPITGNYGNQWKHGVAYFADWADQEINVRFRGYTGNGELSDMAIDDIMITEMTNIESLGNSEKNINIYPNPSNGLFTITFSDEIQNDLSIQVFDPLGRAIISEKINSEISNSNSYIIDLSQFSNGIYYLFIKNGDMITKEKIIKF